EQALMPPVGTSTQGPLFRSFSPTVKPERYFPNLPAIVSGADPTWESLPAVSREMDFRLTVRNYNATYGCTMADDITLVVDGDRGPFVTLDPIPEAQLSAGQIAQIQWDTADTRNSSINSQLVDILLSTNGGQSFTLLATSEVNDGLATVTIPDVISDQARIMVRSADNVFLNVTPGDFRILEASGIPDVTIAAHGPAIVADCFNNSGEASFQLLTAGSNGATAPIIFTAIGLPASVGMEFYPNPVQPGGLTSLRLTGLNDIPEGEYTISVTGNSDEVALFTQLTLIKTGGDGAVGPAILSPALGSTEEDLRPTFSIQENGGDSYQFQLSTDNGFSSLLLNSTTSSPSITYSQYLLGNTLYYWRVRSNDASCGTSAWRNGVFQTRECYVYNSTTASVPISSGPPPVQVFMDVNVPDEGIVTDLDIYQLNINHSYVRDLQVTLIAPDGTQSVVMDRECGNQNNVMISFDDEASQTELPCPPVNPGLFVTAPNEELSVFDNHPTQGNWTLEVNDFANMDGGALNSYGLKVCIADISVLPVEWLTFTAQPEEDYIYLQWQTVEEINNHGFVIERSASLSTDRNWESLDFVPSSGRLTGDYDFVDRTVQTGITYYYRLRQEDIDGAITYSPIRAARLDGKANVLAVSPNPTTGILQYRWLVDQRVNQRYQLLDAHGRQLLANQLQASGGSIDISRLPGGIYWLRVENERNTEIIKVVKH
ncbi:MAG: proprotein convertase P-domain-containing protein, partial [Bacteroidota bacterium]